MLSIKGYDKKLYNFSSLLLNVYKKYVIVYVIYIFSLQNIFLWQIMRLIKVLLNLFSPLTVFELTAIPKRGHIWGHFDMLH